MSATILDGRKTREALLPGLITKIRELSSVPTLAIIQVGDRPDSTAFIKAKKAFAKKIGITEKHIQLPEDVSQSGVIEKTLECNADSGVRGIIVQLPLPVHISRDTVIDAIDPKKDADGLTAVNVKRWLIGDETGAKVPPSHLLPVELQRACEPSPIIPATARGIRELLQFYRINLAGKKVTIVGRSMLVGKPIALMCLNQNATVTVCHSQTPNLEKQTQSADIIISAVGKPGLIKKGHVRKGQIVVDVGITRASDGRLVGDADFESVKDTVSAITPVPGGVGQMTVLALFENLMDLCDS